MQNNIPIVLISDNYFIPYASAAIQSIMENAAQNKNFKIFLLTIDIQEEQKTLLKKQIEQYSNFSINFIDIIERFNTFGINNIQTTQYFPIVVYCKLLIPLFFSEYKKIIFVDSDMIVLTDISTLYDIELGTNLIAAARDAGWITSEWTKKYDEENLKLKNHNDYFNSGLMLINAQDFCKTFDFKEMLICASKLKWSFADQDPYNIFLQGRVLFLPMSWNYVVIDRAKNTTEYEQEITESETNPKVIHYVGRKPWVKYYNVPYFDKFWKYASRTPFIDTITARMKEQGFIVPAAELKNRIFDALLAGGYNDEGICFRFAIRCFIYGVLRQFKKVPFLKKILNKIIVIENKH